MKPLPLVDGCYLIDNSGLEKLKCPQAFEYAEIWGRTPVSNRAGANFGSTIHRGREFRYKLAGTNEVNFEQQVQIEQAMREWLEENPQPEGDFRNFDHACKIMQVYNKIYKKEQFKILSNKNGKPIVEASFALPFGEVYNTPVIYCGKIDLGIEDHNGLWSNDLKTAFQFGETFDKQMEMDGGQRGYVWALQQVTGRKPEGYIIDAIRVRRPKKQDEFSEVSCIDATDFKRMPVYVSQEQLEEWRQDVLQLVANIFNYHSSEHFPRHRWQCTNKYGLCDYYDVCSTVKGQREQILNSSLFEPNVWTKGLKTESEKTK